MGYNPWGHKESDTTEHAHSHRWLSGNLNAGDLGLIPGSGRSPEGGNGNPLRYSCLGNPIDRGAGVGGYSS